MHQIKRYKVIKVMNKRNINDYDLLVGIVIKTPYNLLNS